ncbi:MAG TPA: FtsX-like permease family protein, partial [Longimicrobiales bacterium]|nr:FtsX-like permease family protein [Longimicrobiales bacterium]
RRELAACLALGASRRSVFGRLLLEATVLTAIGALLGIGLARALVRSQAIVGTIAGMPERVGLDASLDARVLLVALGVTAFAALVVSIAPALHLMRLAPGSVLKDGGTGSGRRRPVGQRLLVVGQIAASFVLLVSAAIVFNTFRRVMATDPGFDAQGLTVVSPDFSEAGFDSVQVIAYRQEWRRRAAENPSISGVALASVVPPAPWTRDGWVFRGGEEPPPGIGAHDSPTGGTRAYLDIVSSDFFEVMHIPIQAGRGFLPSDDVGAEPVVIVSRSLAAALWPNVSPLGRMFSLPPADGQRRPPMRVIGVAGDVRFSSIFDESPHVAYMPTAQHPGVPVSFIVRSRSSATIPDATVRAIGTATDVSVPMHTTVIGERINSQVEPQRVASAWIGVFGMVALLLASVGLYGVVAQGVLQRKRELAVRSALGSTPRGLVSLVIGEGVRITLMGAVIGVVIGGAALRVLKSHFAGVSVLDAQSAAVATIVALGLATIVACFVPARRAGRLNPVDALRSD